MSCCIEYVRDTFKKDTFHQNHHHHHHHCDHLADGIWQHFFNGTLKLKHVFRLIHLKTVFTYFIFRFLHENKCFFHVEWTCKINHMHTYKLSDLSRCTWNFLHWKFSKNRKMRQKVYELRITKEVLSVNSIPMCMCIWRF